MPLTPAQKTLHWRKWGDVVNANDWRMEKTRLHPDARRTAEASIYQKLVWKAASALALQEHRSVTADDLRHACYLVATSLVPGWPASARPVASVGDLGNREFSRWLILCDLLIEPDNLGASMKWEHPESSEREGLIASLGKRAPDATLRAIAANAFGTRDWEGLELGDLKKLSRIVNEKQRSYHRPAPAYTEGPF